MGRQRMILVMRRIIKGSTSIPTLVYLKWMNNANEYIYTPERIYECTIRSRVHFKCGWLTILTLLVAYYYIRAYKYRSDVESHADILTVTEIFLSTFLFLSSFAFSFFFCFIFYCLHACLLGSLPCTSLRLLTRKSWCTQCVYISV